MTEKFIFLKSAEHFFYEKLETFFDCCVETLLLSGVASNNSKIEDIDFTSKIQFSEYYLSILQNGTKKIKPFAQVQLMNDNRIDMELMLYDFSSVEEVSYIYMIQNIMDFTSTEDFSCNFWTISEPNKSVIELYWSL